MNKLQLRKEEDIKKFNVDIQIGVVSAYQTYDPESNSEQVVDSCDFKAKTVKTTKGDTIPYDHLVIASGCEANRPHSIINVDCSNVYTLRHYDDAKNIAAGIL